ncbi:MAG: hypothetical protein A2172_04510 [Candidatus Woykebacteria bacterium RBG_13_40_15]|uniref:Uncharacterized protein n=1 Tax=Candidatus Woykebacteria bacterium RBG_13_40_15 TaxID=1802593 RepID=A0A1G1W6Z5_9BACT|nr:MAG: hypothetical protein A2172_04510 [Candidatus Woykebacteria bacterium RBG_13_40_15]
MLLDILQPIGSYGCPSTLFLERGGVLVLVEVVKVLAGQAPEWVEKALIGVRFNATNLPDSIMMYSHAFVGRGLELRYGYAVSAREASRALLAANKPYAANWFSSLLIGEGSLAMALSREEAKIIVQ